MTPIDKTAKYDRQLRLWAANGQAALEECRIGLINGNATGSETLKNLVLPGVGSFTIIDDKKVTQADTGSNFFLDVDCVGRSRAASVCAYLQELNADVRGQYLERDPVSLINEELSYFTNNFDIVLVTELPTDALLTLSKALWSAGIPLLVVRSIGFMGYLRVALPEHTIVETHPDSNVDLRLDVPWPELSNFALSMDLAKMNDNEHTHTPYISLLLYYLEEWKRTNDGQVPSTFEEKSRFKSLIKSGMRNSDEDNFDEAVSNVWRACGRTVISSEVKTVLETAAARQLTAASSDFWFLARAVGDFVRQEGAGLLPVAGTVPDMKSDTTRYISLQKIYRTRALADIAHVKAHLARQLGAHGRPATAIPDETIESFCKHAAFLKVMRYRSLEQELLTAPAGHVIRPAVEQDAESPIVWYLALRAADVLHDETGQFPGAQTDSDSPLSASSAFERDAIALNASVRHMFGQHLPLEADAAIARVTREMARSGDAELHNIASFMGGIAAQEMIKLITRQYVPVDNTVIFDGIKSTTAVYRL